MRTRLKRPMAVSIVVLALAGAIQIISLQRMDQQRRAAPMPKIIASFNHALLMYINESDRLEHQLIKGDPTAWRQLDDEERRWLIDEVARQQDISSEWKEMVLNDTWGRPLRIEVRRPPSGLEFRITSAGPDGKFGTDDDFDSVDQQVYRGVGTR